MPAGAELVHVAIKAETLFTIGPLVVTNSMIGALLASLVLLAARGSSCGSRHRAGPRAVPDRAAGRVAGRHRVRGSSKRWRSYVPLIFGHLPVHPDRQLAQPAAGRRHHRLAGTPMARDHRPFVRAGGSRPELHAWPGASCSFVAFVWWGVRINGRARLPQGAAIAEPRYMAPLMFPIHLISEL